MKEQILSYFRTRWASMICMTIASLFMEPLSFWRGIGAIVFWLAAADMWPRPKSGAA